MTVARVWHAAIFDAAAKILEMMKAPESGAFVVVGDTGIEPVTPAV